MCAAAFQAALIASLEGGAPTVSVGPLDDEEDEALRRAIEASLRDAGPVSPQIGGAEGPSGAGPSQGAAREGPTSPPELLDVRRAGSRAAPAVKAPVQLVEHANGVEVLQRDSMSSIGDVPSTGDEWGVEHMGKLHL